LLYFSYNSRGTRRHPVICGKGRRHALIVMAEKSVITLIAYRHKNAPPGVRIPQIVFGGLENFCTVTRLAEPPV
jgi:hypothetical protein